MEPIVLSTDASSYFANGIVEKLLLAETVSITRKNFGGGERYLRFNIDDRMAFLGRDVIVVGSTPNDNDFAEICRVGSAVAKYGARHVFYVIPFFGYSTMERAVKPGEIVTAKICARQLSQLPHGDIRNYFFMLDLHTAGLEHYFEGDCMRFQLYGESVLTDAVRELELSNFMFGSADLGRPIWVETFAKKFGTSLAFVRKSREFEETQVEDVIGDVAGKTVVIYDDMIRSAKTLVHAADAYLAKGASEVYAVTSHLAFDDEAAIDRLEASAIKKVIGTNSHPMSQHHKVVHSPKFVVKDVSHLFADAIQKIIN
jgi:ribose-phosphate pyrophosphokinase